MDVPNPSSENRPQQIEQAQPRSSEPGVRVWNFLDSGRWARQFCLKSSRNEEVPKRTHVPSARFFIWKTMNYQYTRPAKTLS